MGFFSDVLGGVAKAVLPAVGTAVAPGIGTVLGGVAGSILPSVISGGLSYAGSQQRNQAQMQVAAATGALNQEMAREATAATMEMQTRSHDFQRRQNEIAMTQNVRNMREQQAWLEAMAGTGYQRAMADMRKAGLNPILAYQRGPVSVGGPGSPSGGVSGGSATGMGTAGSAPMPNLIDAVTPALNTAMSVRRLQKEEQLADQQIRVGKATEDKIYEEALRTKAETSNALQEWRIKKREADDTTKYGTSKLAREAAAALRMLRSGAEALGLDLGNSGKALKNGGN